MDSSEKPTAGLRVAHATLASPPSKPKTTTPVGFRSVDRNHEPKGTKPKEKYSPSDIPRLREKWFEECSDLLGPIPLELPPFREINHRIPLMEEDLWYSYHLPHCPEVVQEELRQKITQYTSARWWEMKAVYQAAPLLCVPKKSGKLRTVVDARKRNDNTFKDVTLFPDQDQI